MATEKLKRDKSGRSKARNCVGDHVARGGKYKHVGEKDSPSCLKPSVEFFEREVI